MKKATLTSTIKTVALALLATCLTFCASAQSQSVLLTWNPSPSTNVNAYRIYCWTNLPDAQCAIPNALQSSLLGNVTSITLTNLLPTSYTFGATAVDTNTGNESLLSNLAHWTILSPPGYFVTVQSTTNLALTPWTTVTNSSGQIFFRLVITPAQ